MIYPLIKSRHSPKTIFCFLILAREFCCDKPTVIFRIFKVNQLDSRIRRQYLVEFTTKVVTTQHCTEILRMDFQFMFGFIWIQTNECLKEFIGKNVVILVNATYWSSFATFVKISVPQTAQVKCRGNLNSSTFVETSHIYLTKTFFVRDHFQFQKLNLFFHQSYLKSKLALAMTDDFFGQS